MKFRYIIDIDLFCDENEIDSADWEFKKQLEDFVSDSELGYYANKISVKLQDDYCINQENKRLKAGQKVLEEIGTWIDTDTYDHNLVHIYECSKCHKTVADDYINLHKYCLHCGNPKDAKG